MKKFTLLALVLFFWTNSLQSQTSQDSTEQKKPTETKIVNTENTEGFVLSVSPFFTKLKGEEQFLNWEAYDPGVRLSFSANEPSFVFVYLDAFWEIYKEENFELMGPPSLITERYPVLQGGLGLRGSVPLKWGLGIDGEITYDIVNAFLKGENLPDLSVGFGWENKKETFSVGFLNIIKLQYSSFFNPCVYVNHDIELRRRKKTK